MFVLVGISISDTGLSSLTYFWATFLVQCLRKVSEPPLRCLAEPWQSPLSTCSFWLRWPKRTRQKIPVHGHFPFLMKAFGQRHLQMGLDPFLTKNNQNTLILSIVREDRKDRLWYNTGNPVDFSVVCPIPSSANQLQTVFLQCHPLLRPTTRKSIYAGHQQSRNPHDAPSLQARVRTHEQMNIMTKKGPATTG